MSLFVRPDLYNHVLHEKSHHVLHELNELGIIELIPNEHLFTGVREDLLGRTIEAATISLGMQGRVELSVGMQGRVELTRGEVDWRRRITGHGHGPPSDGVNEVEARSVGGVIELLGRWL